MNRTTKSCSIYLSANFLHLSWSWSKIERVKKVHIESNGSYLLSMWYIRMRQDGSIQHSGSGSYEVHPHSVLRALLLVVAFSISGASCETMMSRRWIDLRGSRCSRRNLGGGETLIDPARYLCMLLQREISPPSYSLKTTELLFAYQQFTIS